MCVEGYCSYSVILSSFMQDFSQPTNADGTKLDIKDEDHGLYALMGLFSLFMGLDRCYTSVHTAGSTIPKISRKQQLLMTPNLI